ncbi:DUF2264 domain-containing protein [uncultured Martelella sp.]|uniref:DUF2264 domain-containing protein n=1 Tax=uncultured Martelella sp. TaxID=392331 RepID=UPI0029C99C61|nr:DUF2264 domain-containing protein [uncultured Martelella sp.]
MTRYASFTSNAMKSRSDFQRLLVDLVTPLLPYLRDQGASVDFHEGGAHYDMRASHLEGVARPLWGIVPYVLGGGTFEHWQLFRNAIIEGTDPNSPRFWGDTTDHNQRSVEMPAIGLLLMALPEYGWEPLTAKQRDNLCRWLARIQCVPMPLNNWRFFTVLVQEALRSVGREDLVDDVLERDFLTQLSNWYLGDGWYGDGRAATVNHYGAFAMHFYGLLYARLAKVPDSELSQLFRQRGKAFIEPFSYWFADDGKCMPVGRSLTYRFATSAFWGMLAAADVPGIDIGVIKGYWARQIRSWRDKPIFTTDGLLTRGYGYPNLLMCEDYNSPTSPYWSFKAFFPLMLAEDSAFWTAEEVPARHEKTVYPMPAASQIAQRIEGESVIHYAAPLHPKVQPDKYNKFAYSTGFAMEVEALQYADLGKFGDNILAFCFDAGFNWQMLRKRMEVLVEDNRLTALWTTGEQEVRTTIDVMQDGSSVRKHAFRLKRPATVVETGFAVYGWYENVSVVLPVAAMTGALGTANSETRADASRVGQVVGVKGTNGISAMQSIDGYAKRSGVSKRTNTNVDEARTAVPFLSVELPAGEHTLVDRFAVSPRSSLDLISRLLR